jgi:hypothetical protein
VGSSPICQETLRPAHVANGVLNAIQTVQRLRIQIRAEILHQDLRKAVDMPQRGAEIVRNGIAEGL